MNVPLSVVIEWAVDTHVRQLTQRLQLQLQPSNTSPLLLCEVADAEKLGVD